MKPFLIIFFSLFISFAQATEVELAVVDAPTEMQLEESSAEMDEKSFLVTHETIQIITGRYLIPKKTVIFTSSPFEDIPTPPPEV